MPMSADVSADALTYYFTGDTLVISRPSARYVALHKADPGRTGANEVTTGDDANYARQVATFTVGDSNADNIFEATNDADVVFAAAAGGSSYTVAFVSVWDAVSGGNMLAYLPLAVSVPVVASTIVNLAAGDILIKGV